MRRNQRRGPSNGLVGIVVLAVLAAVTYMGFAKRLPFRHDYTVKAAFKSANGIRPGSPVRIAGVNIGKVSKVESAGDGREAAIVSMHIDKQGLPIHRDATAAIRPRIMLEGNFFVDLAPGSPSAPKVHDGDTLPINQTSDPVQLDQVLTALQSQTRRQLQLLLDQYSHGIAGSGAEGFRRSMRYWKPAYRDSAIVADAEQGENPHDLSSYLRNAGTTAAAIDRNPRQLQDLVTDFDRTARAFATNNRQLADAVGELPGTLRTGTGALQRLNAAFPNTRKLVRDLRPTVRSSGPALDAGVPFTRELRGLVSKPELQGLTADLRPTVPSVARLNDETQPLYEQVRAASSCQNRVIQPWSHDKIDDPAFPTKDEVFVEAVHPLSGLAGESRSGDANGQWFRTLAGSPTIATPLGDRLFLTTQPLQGVNPTKPEQPTPMKPDVPCETQEPPDLRSIPGPVPKGTPINIPASQQDAWQKMIDKAASSLKADIKDQGLDHLLKVSTEPVTRQQLLDLGGHR